MKIAFDGTVLHGRKSGVGYYCEELLKALLAENRRDEFVVFSHLPLDLSTIRGNGNVAVLNTAHFPVRAVYLHAMLPRLLDRVQPDLCHYTNFLAPFFDDRPYVVTIHDMGLEVLRHAHPLAKRLYTRRLIPHAAKKARLILTNSEYSKWEIVRHLGISEERIRVTPLAASAEFVPTPSEPRGRYFLYVGNLEPRKNLARLLEAFARLPNVDHELWIAGNHWYRGHAIEKTAHTLRLNGRVKFLGYVPRKDLPALFSGATALVYPSLLEGFGLPVVEAMACGTPVITSDNTALREVGAEAALLVNPTDVRSLSDAMRRVAEDKPLREQLSARGLQRSKEFSWQKTAAMTLEAYREALAPNQPHCNRSQAPEDREIVAAIHKTIQYARQFQYPLTRTELRERLFDVQVDQAAFERILANEPGGEDRGLMRLRAEREKISDAAIQKVAPHLKTLARMPFVRMLAFSGSTAHRNMTSMEDVDLFMVVEDGKLWAVFLAAVVWAKVKGLRRTLCMNYLISDAALPLHEHDAFTAQQVASLKPFYGVEVYDRFVERNPFVFRHFPNFDPSLHRAVYPELGSSRTKRYLERMLRLGAVQLAEYFSRTLLSRYLGKKAARARRTGDCDVYLEPRRLKLHMISHKREALGQDHSVGRKSG